MTRIYTSVSIASAGFYCRTDLTELSVRLPELEAVARLFLLAETWSGRFMAIRFEVGEGECARADRAGGFKKQRSTDSRMLLCCCVCVCACAVR